MKFYKQNVTVKFDWLKRAFYNFDWFLAHPGVYVDRCGRINLEMEMSDESEYEADDDDPMPTVRRRSSRKTKQVNYRHLPEEDDFFSGEKGYTNFDRTRKGGDRRPHAVGKVSLFVL